MPVLEPLFARVIVRAEAIEKRLKTSLIIPDQSKDRHAPEQGEIIAVGPTADESIQIGDKVLWGRYAAKEISGWDDHWIMNDEDVLGVIRE